MSKRADALKLVELLGRVKEAEVAIPRNLARLASSMPDASTLMDPEGATPEQVREIYGLFMGGIESMADLARDYADATHALQVHVRESLEPGLRRNGILPEDGPWSPPSV